MPAMRTLKLLRRLLGMLLVIASCCRAETTTAWVVQSAGFQETILSTRSTETDQLVKEGWVIDATGGLLTEWKEGAGPVHRLFRSDSQGVHRVLETDVRQLPVWQKAGFTDEGIVGYVADRDGPGRLAVIQYAKGDRRLWVVSTAAQTKVEQDGWTRQGVHFWLWPVDHKE
jgi:hypothetical protein